MTGAILISDDVVLLLFILCMWGGCFYLYPVYSSCYTFYFSYTLCGGENCHVCYWAIGHDIYIVLFLLFILCREGGGEFLRLIGQSAKIFTSRQQANNILANADITVCGGLVYEKILTNQILINNFQGKVNSFKCTFLSLCCFLKGVEPESGVKNLPTLPKAL